MPRAWSLGSASHTAGAMLVGVQHSLRMTPCFCTTGKAKTVSDFFWDTQGPDVHLRWGVPGCPEMLTPPAGS